MPDVYRPGGAEAAVACLISDGQVRPKADKRDHPRAAAIEQEALGRAAQAAKVADVKFPTLAPVAEVYLAAQRHVWVEGQRLCLAGTAIKEEEARLQRPVEVAGIDFPAAIGFVLLIGGAHLQLVIEGHNLHLACRAVIEEDAIASVGAELADAYLKGIVPAVKIYLAIHREI